jgi:hypothetical protein
MRLVSGGQLLPFTMVIALSFACACYVPSPAPQMVEETVARRLQWVDAHEVPPQFLRVTSAPYVGPYFILISPSGHYCVVTREVYFSVQVNQRWACDWRLQRPA